MGKNVLGMIALMPLLIGGSHASQPESLVVPSAFVMEDLSPGGYLGVDIADINSDRLAALKLKEEKGVEVTMVDQDAPAGKAGIKEHDVILTLNGTPVESKSQLHRMIRETPAGRTIALGLSRDGQPLTVKVQLGDRNKEFEHTVWDGNNNHDFHFEMPEINIPDFDMPNISVVYVRSSTRSGLMVENLTPQLSTFFGTKDGNGVLVRSVERGSRGEKAGLKAGDVIVRVGDRSVHDSDDFSQAMRSQRTVSVGIRVIRDKKEQNFTLSLPEKKDSGKWSEQSTEMPQDDAKEAIEISELNQELAKLGPTIDLATRDSLKASAEIRASILAHEKEIKQQSEELRKTITPKVQEEIKKRTKELRHQLQNLRIGMQGEAFDI